MTAETTSALDGGLGRFATVLVLCVGLAVLPRLLSGRAAVATDRDAPEFSLPIVANGGSVGGDGSTLTMASLRGRAVVLDFWATWCGPCRAEAPIVDGLARRWRDRDVVVVGVNTDTPTQGDPREFARRHGLSYPIVRDETGEASRRYDVDSLPTLVVVSRTGKVVAVRNGMTDDAELDRLVRAAL